MRHYILTCETNRIVVIFITSSSRQCCMGSLMKPIRAHFCSQKYRGKVFMNIHFLSLSMTVIIEVAEAEMQVIGKRPNQQCDKHCCEGKLHCSNNPYGSHHKHWLFPESPTCPNTENFIISEKRETLKGRFNILEPISKGKRSA